MVWTSGFSGNNGTSRLIIIYTSYTEVRGLRCCEDSSLLTDYVVECLPHFSSEVTEFNRALVIFEYCSVLVHLYELSE